MTAWGSESCTDEGRARTSKLSDPSRFVSNESKSSKPFMVHDAAGARGAVGIGQPGYPGRRHGKNSTSKYFMAGKRNRKERTTRRLTSEDVKSMAVLQSSLES